LRKFFAIMKRYVSILVLFALAIVVFAASKKKAKIIDHYYVDQNQNETVYDLATYEIKVFQDADSIVVCSWLIETDLPHSLETYRVLNDSVQDKWGTQILYFPDGSVRRAQFIDKVMGIDHSTSYLIGGQKESEAVINHITGESLMQTWYPSGQLKTQTKTVTDVSYNVKSDIDSWFESGKISRRQSTVNHLTTKLKVYDEDGFVTLSLPCQQGDTVYMNNKGAIAARKVATMYGIFDLQGDSIKVNTYSKSGRLLATENFMKYSPEEAVPWGVQKYYYTTIEQPTDSLVIFKGVNGVNLLEDQYYTDGKKKSTTTITYDRVMLPTKELRQYFQSGKLRRIQKHVGDKLVDGHCYDAEGKEIPFYEFKE